MASFFADFEPLLQLAASIYSGLGFHIDGQAGIQEPKPGRENMRTPGPTQVRVKYFQKLWLKVLRSLQIENKNEQKTDLSQSIFIWWNWCGRSKRVWLDHGYSTEDSFFNAKSCQKNDVLLKIVKSLKNLYSVGFEKRPK